MTEKWGEKKPKQTNKQTKKKEIARRKIIIKKSAMLLLVVSQSETWSMKPSSWFMIKFVPDMTILSICVSSITGECDFEEDLAAIRIPL